VGRWSCSRSSSPASPIASGCHSISSDSSLLLSRCLPPSPLPWRAVRLASSSITSHSASSGCTLLRVRRSRLGCPSWAAADCGCTQGVGLGGDCGVSTGVWWLCIESRVHGCASSRCSCKIGASSTGVKPSCAAAEFGCIMSSGGVAQDKWLWVCCCLVRTYDPGSGRYPFLLRVDRLSPTPIPRSYPVSSKRRLTADHARLLIPVSLAILARYQCGGEAGDKWQMGEV